MGIVIAKVISLPDETGTDVVVEYMQCLGEKALTSLDCHIKLHFLQKALLFMETVPRDRLPDQSGEKLMADLVIEVDGKEYFLNIELVKSLGRQPIYELRIDLHKPHWCFRATFFPKFSDEQQLHYCFVHPFEKVAGLPDPTDGYRDMTFNVLTDLRCYPTKYAHYFS